MIQWYGSPWSEAVKSLKSNIYSGLDEEQIKPYREQYGENVILIPKTKSLTSLIMNQVKELWIILLFICSAIFLYFQEFAMAGMGVTIIIVSTLCFALNEYNEEKNIKELQRFNKGFARVVREGRTLKIPSTELVVGDIVIVGKGEGVPADLRVIESDELKVNESSITGENFISEKYETKIEDKELALSDMKNILFKASVVVGGSGTGIVIATGMDTQISNIIKLFFGEKEKTEYFNRRVNKIINYVSVLILAFMIFNISVGSMVFKEKITYILRDSAVFVLSSIPQGMVIVITIVSAILFKKMKKSSIIMKNISVVEKFSSVNAICTDKVGAFSKDKVKAVKVYTDGNIVDTYGQFLDNNEQGAKNGNLYRILSIGVLCNDTKTNVGKIVSPKNDLIELALIAFGLENGMDKKRLDREHRRVLQIPFDTERRIMTTINVIDENYRANIKGTVDSLLSRCTHIMKNGVETEITEEDINAIKKADITMSIESLSVIGFAYRNFNYEPSRKENIESNLVFVGLVGFENVLREEAIESIKKSKALGIKPIIITEDSKLTAFAFGKKMGVISKLQEIVSGVEIDNMSDEEFERIGEKIGIFSRISPRNKVKAIKALKGYGYTTAITGSKLVDLPSLKISDIGITTSKSNIVKKLSDVLLNNINFVDILNVLEDSRKIVSVLKKVISYIVSCSVTMVTFITLIYSWKYKVPLMAVEAFWFNNIIMILSSLALIYQYKDEVLYGVESVIDKNIIKERALFIVSRGVLMGIIAFVVFVLGYSKGIGFAQVTAFTILNLNAVFFNYSFSNKLLFKSKISNLIILLNVIIQFVFSIIIYGIAIIINIAYWKTVGIFMCIWIVIAMVGKFNEEGQYD
ncbi:cation-translocating P-type ATPase [Clostridium magnum]|uniref:Calcium-transporting ATPase 1 n=1 Tax=Clostridium magnum DSM 2767 TaxID=1121326 RepID=A0A161Y6D3_9CLOT|nr:HAD-IC family P-type ATPase [Clostridium magnum]KZL93869.1 calcium-transporting ATPase 1 [Clostridium magnum DSM 2767]SHH97534.1 ATPase, P-type (transporting), HAD superfamily, subfamily IC [Clostridium magnum DSM 2767]